VNREEIHSLLGLPGDGLEYYLGINLFNIPVLYNLIDRNSPKRHGAARQQLPPGLVQVASRAEVHYRIGPGIQGSLHLLNLIFDC